MWAKFNNPAYTPPKPKKSPFKKFLKGLEKVLKCAGELMSVE